MSSMTSYILPLAVLGGLVYGIATRRRWLWISATCLLGASFVYFLLFGVGYGSGYSVSQLDAGGQNPTNALGFTDGPDGHATSEQGEAGLILATAANGQTGYVPSDAIESVIQITGEATISRALEGTVVVSGPWGKGPGEFGLCDGSPREGPSALAVSPVDGRIAVLDWANSRIQVFDGGASVAATYELPGTAGGYCDIAFDSANRVVALRTVPGNSGVIVYGPTGRVEVTYEIPTEINAERLSIVGDDIWVWTADNVSYPVVFGAKAFKGDELINSCEDAFVTQTGAVNVSIQSAGSLQATITKADDTIRRIRIESSLPLFSIQVEANAKEDASYFATRIYAPDDGSVKESWCVIGIAADGSKVGQVRWPCTYWASGGFRVGSDGAVYNMNSFEDHLEIVKYELDQ